MSSSDQSLAERAPDETAALDPAICSLLDHVAGELAEEYIRLMEAAAEAEIATEPSRSLMKEADR